MIMQRLPLIDHGSRTASEKPLDLVTSIVYSVAYGVVLLMGVFILFIFTLVPVSKDIEQ